MKDESSDDNRSSLGEFQVDKDIVAKVKFQAWFKGWYEGRYGAGCKVVDRRVGEA